MPAQNPFTTTFSRIPKTHIVRNELNKIIENFEFEEPTESVYKITGVRGSGKTVGLAQIEESYTKKALKEDWIVYRLNPSRDMLLQLGAALNKEHFVSKKIKGFEANINMTVLGTGGGIGGSFTGADAIFDIGVEIHLMLKQAQAKKKKILLTIDEASKTNYMVQFCLEFGQWLREGLPVYLVCTGLYENITELGNVKNLTFFRRAPAVIMKPLSTVLMSEAYHKALKLDLKACQHFAEETKGYAYAFQQYGSLLFEGETTDVISELKINLFGNVYEKIWEELSENDKKVLRTMPENRIYKREEIVEKLGESKNIYSEYRDRLIKRGIIITPQYGYVSVALPFFDEYIADYGSTY
ncbi:MAG: hypothetical protein Q4F55_05425 [Bacillota bacterium]|nr:hypothetical protein [Bacillota bacterium]